MRQAPVETRIHAGAVVLREDGVLIRGESGTGKSSLALALVAEGRRAGWFSRMVADDRVLLRAVGGRLVARPHERAGGMVERRGVGILTVEHEPACVIHLVLDLVPGRTAKPARMPEPQDLTAEILGLSLPRLVLDAEACVSDKVYRVMEAFAPFRAGS